MVGAKMDPENEFRAEMIASRLQTRGDIFLCPLSGQPCGGVRLSKMLNRASTLVLGADIYLQLLTLFICELVACHILVHP